MDGTIGAGKSTLIKSLKFPPRFEVIKICEPIEEWVPFLEKIKEDPSNTFNFQCKVLNHWTNVLFSISSYIPLKPTIFIIERSPESAYYVFSKIALENNNLSSLQFSVIKKLYDQTKFPIDLWIFLNLPPSLAIQRIISRDRDCESSLPLSYLNNLHVKYAHLRNNLFSEQGVIVNASFSKDIVLLNVSSIIASFLLKNL